MLEIITKSKIRRKLILLFLYNQNKEFYLSEIARQVGTSPGTTQRELNRLLENDFIIFKKKANLNMYRLNLEYALLREIESIVKKTIGIETELKKALSRIAKIRYAFLFGSYVKGGFKSDSDIDLFIIGDPVEDRVFEIVQGVEQIVGKEINYHISSLKEFAFKLKQEFFYKDMIKNVVLLIGDKSEFRAQLK